MEGPAFGDNVLRRGEGDGISGGLLHMTEELKNLYWKRDDREEVDNPVEGEVARDGVEEDLPRKLMLLMVSIKHKA